MDKLKIVFLMSIFVGLTMVLSGCQRTTNNKQEIFISSTTASNLEELPNENFDSYLEISSADNSDNIAIPDGRNTYTWDSGSYSGFFKDGKANGYGKFTADDYILDGTFIDNKLDSGSLVVKSENYKINFNVTNGAISNHIEIEFASGDSYSGDWDNGVSGTGTLKYKNGDIFVGEFYNGKRSGLGVYTWNNGESYDGNWLEDKMNGNGIYYYDKAKSQSLTGNFANNIPNGTLIYKKNEQTYLTVWIDGKCKDITLGGETNE